MNNCGRTICEGGSISMKVLGVKMRYIAVAIILLCGVMCLADQEAPEKIRRDVNNVSFRGECTNFGMKIEGVYLHNGRFVVVTTGARFEYLLGELKIYQGLGSDIGRRLIATMTIEDVNGFEKVESNDDHVLFWSEKLNIGIYGDSTCILAPKEKLSIRFKGNFKPDYEGRYEGELLLIDEAGGIEIYPQRYEAGYEVKRIELGKTDWLAEYLVNANERVMIAAFPAKKFDWERSFSSNILITYGSRGLGVGNPYGQMPSNETVKKWAQNGFDIVVMFYEGLYAEVQRLPYPFPSGPHIVVNKPEFNRFVKALHTHGLKISPYVSLYYHYRKFSNVEVFYEEVKALRSTYGIDGVYLDGMLREDRSNKIDDKIQNWEMIRRLRQLFGPDGSIIYHGTNRGSPVATTPNVDSYCTATLNGEGVSIKSVNDPYVKYQVRKYGISNTIALWLASKKKRPSYITDRDVIDAIIAMNGRAYSWGYVAVNEPPKSGKYNWGDGLGSTSYRYYLKRIAPLKEAYYRKSRTEKNRR